MLVHRSRSRRCQRGTPRRHGDPDTDMGSEPSSSSQQMPAAQRSDEEIEFVPPQPKTSTCLGLRNAHQLRRSRALEAILDSAAENPEGLGDEASKRSGPVAEKCGPDCSCATMSRKDMRLAARSKEQHLLFVYIGNDTSGERQSWLRAAS